VSTREEILKELGVTPIWRLGKGSYAGFSTVAEDNGASRLEVKGGVREKVGQLGKGAVSIGKSCVLLNSGSHVVMGSGDRQADWLFVGEALGAEDNISDESFPGELGELLDNMLSAMHLRRDNKVYFLNVVQCRLTNDQGLDPRESASCTQFLRQQIQIIQPSIIVTLGSLSSERLIGLNQDLSEYRQVQHECWGVNLVATYHPQDLLENPLDKANAWKDLCFAINMKNRIERAKATVSADQ